MLAQSLRESERPAVVLVLIAARLNRRRVDMSDLGRDVIRLEGSRRSASRRAAGGPGPGVRGQLVRQIAAIFGTAERFAELFSEALGDPTARLHA